MTIQLMRIVMIILALYNLRQSRGDWRNALRYAGIVGGLYALYHLLSVLLQHRSLGEVINLLGGSDTGHVLLHMVDVWVIYVAIEPYVRRVWPRMLIGTVRMLSGRLRDPAVGREILIGAVVGSVLLALVAVTSYAGSLTSAGLGAHLPDMESIASRTSPIQFLCFKVHRAAWTLLDSMRVAGILVAFRLLSRHSFVALLLGVIVLGFTAEQWYLNTFGGPWWLGLPYAACFGIAMVVLYTRVGILAGMIAVFVLLPNRLIGLDFDAWFTPYATIELVIPIALAAYGFWVAVAGQPIFKDILAEPKPIG